MADYATVADVKAYLRIGSAADDELLAGLVTRASRLIDDRCERWFVAREETRTYDATGPHITGRLLLLDADLLEVSELINGDGTPINLDDVILRPVNWPPYFGIALRAAGPAGSLHWTDGGDPDGMIQVTGLWGYSVTPPEPIVHATVRLAAWLYRQRDTGADGSALPPDVREMIAPYMRLRIKAFGG